MNDRILNYNTPGKFEVKLRKGIYRFECWGASCVSLEFENSSGAYTSGIISVVSMRKFFLFVGEKGTPRNTTVTLNDGGAAYNVTGTSGNIAVSYGSS